VRPLRHHENARFGSPFGIPPPDGWKRRATILGQIGPAEIGTSDAGEIERAVTAFAPASNGGLIVTPVTLAIVHRDLIITLAARHRLPAVYGHRLRA
jgi:hypothetical protein